MLTNGPDLNLGCVPWVHKFAFNEPTSTIYFPTTLGATKRVG
jgi:hypothetical protein